MADEDLEQLTSNELIAIELMETAGAAKDQRRRGTEHTWTKPESAAALMAVPKTEYLELRALRRGFPRDAFPPLVQRPPSARRVIWEANAAT
jgi:hypothetical protein